MASGGGGVVVVVVVVTAAAVTFVAKRNDVDLNRELDLISILT